MRDFVSRSSRVGLGYVDDGNALPVNARLRPDDSRAVVTIDTRPELVLSPGNARGLAALLLAAAREATRLDADRRRDARKGGRFA